MKLHGQGMTKMFLDGVANGVTELKQLGEQIFSGSLLTF
jgi:hypothetical protein